MHVASSWFLCEQLLLKGKIRKSANLTIPRIVTVRTWNTVQSSLADLYTLLILWTEAADNKMKLRRRNTDCIYFEIKTSKARYCRLMVGHLVWSGDWHYVAISFVICNDINQSFGDEIRPKNKKRMYIRSHHLYYLIFQVPKWHKWEI